LVVGLAVEFGLHQVEHGVRSRQAADMGGLNAIGVLLNGHWCLLKFGRAVDAALNSALGIPTSLEFPSVPLRPLHRRDGGVAA
jgi:hypothetical protein